MQNWSFFHAMKLKKIFYKSDVIRKTKIVLILKYKVQMVKKLW